jgi:hypothetical protein
MIPSNTAFWKNPFNFEPEAISLFTRMAVLNEEPDFNRKLAINRLIKAEKECGNWSKYETFWVLAAHSRVAGRFNWLSNSFTLTEFNNPNFTINQGFNGNGSNMYLATGWIPSQHQTITSNINSSIGVWSLTNTSNTSYYDMGAPSAYMNLRRPSSVWFDIRSMSSNGSMNGIDLQDSLGLFTAVKTGSSAQSLYKNGVLRASSTPGNAANSSSQFTLLAYVAGNLYSIRRLAFAFIGNNQIDFEKQHQNVSEYLTEVGAI